MVAARAAINRCALELQPHGPAVVELLSAIACVYERRATAMGKPLELSSAVLGWLAASVLNVPASVQYEIHNRIHAEEAKRSR